ncbi:chromosome segregation protein SMC [Allofustis seminis]|uniref:chromosome segregation protein SMC n=1 Tax=Allofustis seminis TaxID=166939 RepID=UPI000360A749|nr:chromosome segregation protein SMC [Allofustis seminis]
MKIKQLKIKGFKSFANETVLDFNEGFTAIVGPNGSGKSNLIEAIRWVMGEQSAKSLRGGRMHDVIFSGTKLRPALNIATVELILDNEDRFLPIDFDEVSILRRISKTGESLYQINQQDCRLKDIVDLFLDSGLGKESFSVISQGQVEAIFNAKPEDRRAIFEEVAGVFKYKTQKETAEKKLEKTQENLDRVQDILYEIEKQINPLKEQAEKAELYQEKRNKLSDLDIAVTVSQIEKYAHEQKETKHVTGEISEEIQQIHKQKFTQNAALAQHQGQLDEIESEQIALNRELLELTQQVERNEAALSLLSEKKKHQEIYKKEKQIAIEQLHEQNKNIKRALDQNQAELDNIREQLQVKINEIERIEKNRQQLETNPEKILAELRDDYLIQMQELTQVTNQIEYAKKEREKNEALFTRLKEERHHFEEECKARRTTYDQLQKALDKNKKQLVQLLSDHQTLMTQIEQQEEVVVAKQKRWQDVQETLHRAQMEYRTLTEMQENYTGYYAGVRAVMKNQAQIEGIIGTVAELIDIPSQYLTALDTALASTSQFIVTEDEKGAQRAIAYLKKTRKGRATFLPLTSIKARKIDAKSYHQIKDMPGFLAVANEIVSIETHAKKVAEHLLGHTIIAQDLKSATALAREINHRYKVVTLEGDVINPGGSMTGGDSAGRNKAQPIFMQQEKQRQIEIIMKEAQQTLPIVEQKYKKSQKELDALKEQLDEINEKGAQTRQLEQQELADLKTLNIQLEQSERALKGIDFEWSEAELSQNEVQLQYENAIDQKQHLTNKVAELKEQMDRLQLKQEDLVAEKDKLFQEGQALQLQKQEINEQHAILLTEIRQLQQNLSENDNKKNSLMDELEQAHQEKAIYSKEELLNKKEKITAQMAQVNTKLTALQSLQKQLRSEIEHLNQEVVVLTESGEKYNEQLNALKVSYSKRDVKLDYLLQYLVEEYQVSYEEARFINSESLDINKAQSTVKQLKNEIKALGPVNLSAIDEYQVVFERFEFLSQQQSDLIEAKQKLFDTMDKMDHEVKYRFKETFEKIQEQFAVVFPQMFGGGKAELQLTNPSDLLETGIEIIAQPPGKQLTRLSLLSGGERALTAISLLFAIIRVRPIPFCILDEVESSLDEANVSRFGSYLQEFENQTQFIVITHRKGTMEEADRLYGVTMQEQGISKLVSVSLKEAEGMDHVV